MVFGFTTACAISAYHHRSCEFESHSGVLYATLCDNVCQWLAAGCWFYPGTPVSFTNKTDRHDITEIFLKVVVNTISLSLTLFLWICEGRNLLFSLLSLTQISCLFIHLWLLYGQTQEHDWSHHLQCLSVTIMNLLTVTEYRVTNYHGYISFVVIIIRAFPHLRLIITGFVTRRAPHVEQKLFTLTEHLILLRS